MAAADQPVHGVEEEESGRDSEDGSSSSDSDEDISDAVMQQVMDLEGKLAENPFLYDVHVQYISLLRTSRLHERLTTARKTMHKLFPLAETLWMDWIEDELLLMDPSGVGSLTAQQAADVAALYEAAVSDYLSVSLWVNYLRFLQHRDPEVAVFIDAGVARFREVAECAVTAAGLHVTQGLNVWKAWRAFEMAFLDHTAKAGGSAQNQQVAALRKLWQRQLCVPLEGVAAELQAYKDWEAALPTHLQAEVPASVATSVKAAQDGVKLRVAREEAVALPDGCTPTESHLAAYMAYVQLEEMQGDAARVQVVYERAVATFPVTPYLWQQYARYCEANIKISQVILSVYKRAVHNCPWSGTLWARYLAAAERSGQTQDRQQELYTAALKAGLQSAEEYLEVVLSRMDSLRRGGTSCIAALRRVHHEALELMSSYFSDWIDRDLRLTEYAARCEVDADGGEGAGMKGARAVWEQALKGKLGRYATTWAAYVDMERRHRHLKEARALFKRAYRRNFEAGGQAALCQAWLRFEREEGSAEDQLVACLKVEPVLTELLAVEAAKADTAAAAAAQRAAKKAPKLTAEEMKELRRAKDPNFGKKADKAKKGKKRSAPAEANAMAASGEAAENAKRQKVASGIGVGVAATLQALTANGAGDTGAAAAVNAGSKPDVDTDKQQASAGAHAGAQAAAISPEEAARPVPAAGSNSLPSQHGVPHQPRGPSHVRPSVEHVAFVRNVAQEVTQDDLQELFGPCGPLKGVRLPLNWNTSKPRGIAYIEFDTEEALQEALKLDSTELKGMKLSVVRSAPPGEGGRGGAGQGRGGRGTGTYPPHGGRARGREGRQGRTGGRGVGFQPQLRDEGMRGEGEGAQQRQRLQLPAGPVTGFVPRSVKSSGAAGAKPATVAGQQGSQAKSNADFRSMFVKAKDSNAG